MRPDQIGYLSTLALYLVGLIVGALKGWRAYTDRTKAINRLAAAVERRAMQCDDPLTRRIPDEPLSRPRAALPSRPR